MENNAAKVYLFHDEDNPADQNNALKIACGKGNCDVHRPYGFQARSISVAFHSVFDLKLSGLHQTEIIIKVFVINRQYIHAINVSICEVNSDTYCFLPATNKDCMNSIF